MFRTLRIFVALLLLPVPTLEQSSKQQIQTETDLASALCAARQDQDSREGLLKAYPQLVTIDLWNDLSDLAAAAYYQQPPKRCLEIYQVAVQIATQLRDAKLLATTYYNLGRTYSGLNQFTLAIEAYEKSRGYFEQAGLQRDLIYILADLGAFYFNQEDYKRAKNYSERSILIADSVKASNIRAGAWPDDFGRARSLQTLGEIDLQEGNHPEAIDDFQRSLRLYLQLNGEGSSYDSYIAGAYASLGKVYPVAGDYAQALLYLNKALDIAKASSDRDTMANILNSVGFLYMEQEDYALARTQFDRSLKIYLADNNQLEASKLLSNLGVLEQRQGHYDEALTQFRLSL